MPEFYIKIAWNFFSRILGGGGTSPNPPLPPVSYAYGIQLGRDGEAVAGSSSAVEVAPPAEVDNWSNFANVSARIFSTDVEMS